MKRGRKATPTETKRRRGNPGKRRRNAAEPQPPRSLALCPDWLAETDPEAAGLWAEVAPILLSLGVLTDADTETLANLCSVRAIKRWAQRELLAGRVLVLDGEKGRQKEPLVNIYREYANLDRLLSAEFGMTPSSRSGIQVPPKAELDPEKLARRAAMHGLQLVPGG